MPNGERLFKFLASLMVRDFYGAVTIRFEHGKVTHVETETRRIWQYKDLPEAPPDSRIVPFGAQAPCLANAQGEDLVRRTDGQ